MTPRRQRRWLRRSFPKPLAARCRFHVLPFVLLGLLSLRVLAQPSPPDNPHPTQPDPPRGLRPLVVGLVFEPELVRHQARFDVGGCPGQYLPGYQAGTRFGIFAFGHVPWSLPLQATGSLYWRDISTRLISSSFAEEAHNEFTGGYDTVTIHTRFDATLHGVGASVGLAWTPNPLLRLGLGPGLLVLSGSAGYHSDSVLSPIVYRFARNDSMVRERTNVNPVRFRRALWSAELTVGTQVAVGPRLALYPVLRGSLGLNDVATTGPWGTWSLGVSIGLGYDIGRRDTIPVVVAVQEPRPEPPPRKPFLAATVTARGIDENGVEYDNPIIEIEETPWIQIVPLIPNVFFDSASVHLPDRYRLLESREQADRFSVDSLLKVGPLDMHWQLLNVIGSRLRRIPAATGTIVGTGSTDEMTSPAGERLALGRAEAIRDYLVSIWGIDPARLKLSWRPTPSAPSSEETSDGRAENRRVEFSFSDPAILGQVVVRRLATIASPPAVKFYAKITADTTIVQSRLSVVQGDKELLRFVGSGEQQKQEQNKLWSLADLRVNRDLSEIRYRLEVRDTTGQTATAEGVFRVIERHRQLPAAGHGVSPELVEHYLVGFNYNSAELLPEHRERLEEIASTIDSASELIIIGYTDKLGDVERNRRLSLERATVVSDALRDLLNRPGMNGGKPAATSVRGFGPHEQLFDNAIPEGRLFSRMVRVIVSRVPDM